MKRSIHNRTRIGLVCMVVMFAISLQCTVLSSFLSALHEVEHAGELFDAHSFAHDHHHGGEDGHHHPGIHHPDSDASSGSRLTLDGHSHGADPNHVSGEHGFFHFSGAPVLFDQDEDPFPPWRAPSRGDAVGLLSFGPALCTSGRAPQTAHRLSSRQGRIRSSADTGFSPGGADGHWLIQTRATSAAGSALAHQAMPFGLTESVPRALDFGEGMAPARGLIAAA
ncbi:hypothetical protein [Luteimonas granuli]|uniref:Uncharacterized protein n=1 Tax=Luteimonas granuli TaxID=1176533 RepID=A0A518N1R0_9GAMM|nr:hypothetical protein [Luteimonas granuli]QDW65834.1 hypothetical protein FPZ22_02075 [Luteimonas granuli]